MVDCESTPSWKSIFELLIGIWIQEPCPERIFGHLFNCKHAIIDDSQRKPGWLTTCLRFLKRMQRQKRRYSTNEKQKAKSRKADARSDGIPGILKAIIAGYSPMIYFKLASDMVRFLLWKFGSFIRRTYSTDHLLSQPVHSDDHHFPHLVESFLFRRSYRGWDQLGGSRWLWGKNNWHLGQDHETLFL